VSDATYTSTVTSNPRICVCVLRIVVLSLVLTLFPASAYRDESPFYEAPALVIAAARSQASDVRAVRACEMAVVTREPAEKPCALAVVGRTTSDFVRVFPRFVADCSWLC
jgi:hypothetical protein